MTPAEFLMVSKGRVNHALTERRWMDTMAAGIAAMIVRVAGVDIERSDCLSFSYPDDERTPEVMAVEETIDVFKEWVTVTGGKTI